MKEHFENTTRITQEGYVAILRVRRRRHRLLCRICSMALAAPLVGRLIYQLVALFSGAVDRPHFQWYDFLFLGMLAVAVWVWCYPQRLIRLYLHNNRNKLHLGAVHHYVFFSDHLQMMTTVSPEKFDVDYTGLTWVYPSGHWMVLYFAGQRLCLLVDRHGFTQGTAEACLGFLRKKLASSCP